MFPLTVGDDMTDDELAHWYRIMSETFGDNLPNIEREPIRFKYYVKLFKHLMKKHHGVIL